MNYKNVYDVYDKDFPAQDSRKFLCFKNKIVFFMTDQMIEPIALTDGAVNQLKKIMADQSVPNDYGLRIGVKGGGCSGFSYVLGFDQQTEKDQVHHINGIKVLMEKSHGIYLLGMEIDWVEGLNNRGFTFNNPNAKESCGCGTSFSA